jgi:hypothetical protein
MRKRIRSVTYRENKEKKMSKTYHIGMVEDKGFGLVTLLKIGTVAAAGYVAYTRFLKKDADSTDVTETGEEGTANAGFSIDKAAKDAGDFAVKVLKAAKKIPDALKE